MPKRKIRSAGRTTGDVHVFWTDDRDRAEEVADVMRDDPEQVELTEYP